MPNKKDHKTDLQKTKQRSRTKTNKINAIMRFLIKHPTDKNNLEALDKWQKR